MELYAFENVVGINQQDDNVKGRECMEDEDWKNLRQETP